MKDQNKIKTYLIFLYGEYENMENILELISLQISNFTTKDSYVKYNYGESNAVIHFESTLNFYELRDYIHLILENVCSQYFLLERPASFYAYMETEMKLNLFNLIEDNSKDTKKKFDKKDTKTNIFDIFDRFIIETANNFFPEDMLSEENMEKMFNNITNKMKGEEDPTIDEILDKISKSGIESLNRNEIKILNEYSKENNDD